MKLGRRKAIQLGLGAAVGLSMTGCESLEQRFTKPELPKAAWAPTSLASPEARLLNRIGFGPNPSDLATVRSMGIPAYITRQLNPDSIAEPAILTYRVRSLNDIQLGLLRGLTHSFFRLPCPADPTPMDQNLHKLGTIIPPADNRIFRRRQEQKALPEY